jgi:uncharacterized RDD family membrane protein YckC
MPNIANNPPSAAAPLAFTGLRKRMASWLYEGMLIFAVVFIAAWLFSTLGQMRNAMDARHTLLQAFLFVVLGVYFVWFWHRGQTLAMKTWHIRIVTTDGQAVSQSRALARYLLSWLWFLPPLALMAPFKLSGAEVSLITSGWIIFYALLTRLHGQRQFVHDALAGTRLINHAPMSK